jgi:hypothetical protein
MQSSEETTLELLAAWNRSSPAVKEKAKLLAQQLAMHELVEMSLALYSLLYGKGYPVEDVRNFFTRVVTWRLAQLLGDKKVSAVQKQQVQLWLSRELKKESIKRSFPELLLSETAYIDQLSAYKGHNEGFAFMAASLLVKKHDSELEELLESLFVIRREYRDISEIVAAIIEKKTLDSRLLSYLTKLVEVHAFLIMKSATNPRTIYEKATYYGVYDQLVRQRDQLESKLLASHDDIEDFLNDFSGASLRKTALTQLLILLRQ